MVAVACGVSVCLWTVALGGQAVQQGTGVVQAVPDKAAFTEWLAGFRQDALKNGISTATLDRALADLEPLAIVIERDRTQAEQVLPLDAYLQRRLNAKTVRTARQMAAQNRAVTQACLVRLRTAAVRRRVGLGSRVHIRPVHRDASNHRGARDAGPRQPAGGDVPLRVDRRAAHRRGRATSSPPA